MVIGVTSDWASETSLRKAWHRVRRNNGRAGADGVSLAELQHDLRNNLRRLSADLQNASYKPVRTFNIRKTKQDGSIRWIRIPSVRDRIAQSACAATISDIFDPRMGETSFAFRPNKSVEKAAGRIAQLRLQGWQFGLRTDIRRFFDEIPVNVLMEQIAPSLPCKGTEAVIRFWIRGSARYGRGIGQGSPLSPVLANTYLIPFDRSLNRGKLRIIRYSDDILVLCKQASSIETARWRLHEELRHLGLRGNADKTEAVSFETGFEFLGLRFVKDQIGPASEAEPHNLIWA